MRRHKPGLRTLFSTGQSRDQLDGAYAERCAILSKPFRRQELLLVLQQLLDS